MSVAWFDPPIDITPSSFSADTWTDLDLTGDGVPSGATGVIIHVQNTSASNQHVGLRKNGSTDNDITLQNDMEENSHGWWMIGVDGGQIIEFYFENTGANVVKLWLVGYTDDDWAFLTNQTDYTPGTANTFTDADITADTTGVAIGAVFNITSNFSSSSMTGGARKNGSTDDRVQLWETTMYAVVGLDAGEIAEVEVGNTANWVGLIGYCTANAVFNTNATDVSLGSTGTWINLTTLIAGATGGIYETITTGKTQTCGFRKDGTSENIQDSSLGQHGWTEVEAASQIAEGIISNTGVDMFEIGYFEPNAGGGDINVLRRRMMEGHR